MGQLRDWARLDALENDIAMTPARLKQRWSRLSDWLTTAAIAAWGILLLNYWASGKLGLLIHPKYFGLTVSAGLFLIILATLHGVKLVRQRSGVRLQHFSLIPPGWLGAVMLVAALVGLLVTPRPFASQTAIQRGLQDSALITRTRPQTFRVSNNPETRSLVEWIRTLDVYPEPDAYEGQPVNIDGFVVYPADLPETYLTLTQFVITCCAADAYPVGLPVKLAQSRQAYPIDRWFEVKGKMITETLNNQRQLVVLATALDSIPEPKNPYSY